MPISAHQGRPELISASAAFVDTEAEAERVGEAGRVAEAEAGREDEAAADGAPDGAAAVRLVLVSPILSCSGSKSL